MATRKIFTNQEFQPSAFLVNPKVHSISDLTQHTGSVGQLATNNANLYFHDGSNWFALIESNYSGLLTGAPGFDPSSGNVPFTVGAGHTGKVENLNADLLDGADTSTTAQDGAIPIYGSSGALKVGTPAVDGDAATKLYVDNAIQGLDIKASVAAATTGNITLSGNQTIDGISITAGMRVLVKNQSTASENGIYVSSASSWGLADDSDSESLSDGAYVFVEGGTVGNNTGWTYVNDGAYTWVQFSGAGQITAGDGLTKSGDTLNASVASPLSISNDQITIADGAISGVKLDSGIAGDGLAFATGVLSVNVSGPLSISADTLTIADGAIGGAKLNTAIAGDGLGISAGVLSVNVSGPLSIDTDTLTIADGAIGGAKLNTAIAGDGLAISAGVLGVNVSGPISISGDSLTIADGALTGSKLANDTVTSTQLANSITVTDLLVQDASLATLIVGSTGGAGAEIILDGAANGDGSGSDFAYIKMTSGDDLHIVNQQTAGTMLFATGSVTRATIAADGKVKLFQNTGIGVDPSSTYKLLVSGDSKIDGTLEVSTPTANAHATTKLYVDDAVSAASVSNIVAGDGLAKSGNTLSVNTTGPISISSDSVTIADQAITGAKLANNTVTSTQIADNLLLDWVRLSDFLEIRADDAQLYFENASNNRYWRQQIVANSTQYDFKFDYYNGTSTSDVLTLENDGDVKAHNRLGVGGTPVSVLSLVSGSRTLDFELKDTPASGDQGIQLIGGSGDSIGISAGGTGPGLILDTINRLGIRTDSMSSQDSTADDLVVGDGLGHYGITLYSAATYKGTIAFADPNSNYQGALVYDHNNDSLALYTGGTSRFSIDSSGNGSITGTFGVATPTAGGHATTKTYVDNAVSAADVSNLVAGDGLAKSGNTLSVNTTSPISISSDSLTIADGALTGAKLANNTVTSTQLADTIQVSSLGVGVDPANYSSAANKLALGGTSGNQGLTIVSGSDSEGAIYWADGTSGNQQYRGYAVYQHASDQLVFGSAGANRLTIESDGDVKVHERLGIGVTPTAALTVRHDTIPQMVLGYASGTNEHRFYWDSSKLYLSADHNNAVANSGIFMLVDGSTVLQAEDDGDIRIFNKLGVGVTPDNTLHLKADDCEVKIERTGSYADTLFMGFPSGLPFIAGADGLAFGASGKWTEHMRLTSSGNILPGADASYSIGSSSLRFYEVASTRFSAADGSESSPTFRFINDTDTGLFRSGSNTLNFSTGGSERMRLTSSGELQLTGNGVLKNQESNGNYSYLQQTSSDARLFVQYSQPLLLGTAATTRLTIEADGDVQVHNKLGVGVTPSSHLHISAGTGGVNTQILSRTFLGSQHANHSTVLGYSVKADTGNTAQMVVTETSGSGAAGNPAAIRMSTGAIEFHAASSGTANAAFDSMRMKLTATGLGVGVSPTELLTLKGQGHSVPTFAIQRSGSATTQFRITNAESSAATTTRGTSTGQWANVIDSNNSNLFLTSYAAGGTGGAIVLDADKVGIGTTGPTHRLTLGDISSSVATGRELVFYRQSNDISTGYDSTLAIYSKTNSFGTYEGAHFRARGFKFQRHDGSQEYLSINNDGNVGIGTVGPSYPLHVYRSGSDSEVYIKGASSGADARLFISGYESSEIWIDRNGVGRWALRRQTGTDDLYLYTQTDAYADSSVIQFWDYSSGYVGIGTESPDSKLNIEVSAESSVPALGANTSFLKISNSGGAYGSMIGQLGTGNSYFQVQRFDGSATAYDLLLQPNGGNVGIGTTSPAYKLDVVGDGHFSGAVYGGNLVMAPSSATNTIRDTNGSGIYVGYGSPSTGRVVNLGYAGTELVVLKSGNVGIGTTSPAQKLHVYTDAGSSGSNLRLEAPVYPSLEFYGTSTDSSNRNFKIASTYNVYGVMEILSSTSQGGTPTTSRLSIAGTTGSVGIGISSPYSTNSTKLDVRGSINFDGNALIAYGANTTTNIDHIWHNDTSAGGAGGTWNFCSDTTYKNTGNSRVRAGHFYASEATQDSYFGGTLSIGGSHQRPLTVYSGSDEEQIMCKTFVSSARAQIRYTNLYGDFGAGILSGTTGDFGIESYTNGKNIKFNVKNNDSTVSVMSLSAAGGVYIGSQFGLNGNLNLVTASSGASATIRFNNYSGNTSIGEIKAYQSSDASNGFAFGHSGSEYLKIESDGGVTASNGSGGALKQVARIHSADFTGDGSTTSFAISHNLQNGDAIVSVKDKSTLHVVNTQVVITNNNTVTITFNTAPANGAEYSVTVVG